MWCFTVQRQALVKERRYSEAQLSVAMQPNYQSPKVSRCYAQVRAFGFRPRRPHFEGGEKQ